MLGKLYAIGWIQYGVSFLGSNFHPLIDEKFMDVKLVLTINGRFKHSKITSAYNFPFLAR
jgi:hypothetical protein